MMTRQELCGPATRHTQQSVCSSVFSQQQALEAALAISTLKQGAVFSGSLGVPPDPISQHNQGLGPSPRTPASYEADSSSPVCLRTGRDVHLGPGTAHVLTALGSAQEQRAS
jgi:hypothetical protein